MNIILIGFMGSGKSSVARILSQKLNLELVELDDLVLKKSGRTNISEIFAKDGESEFRKLEKEVSLSLQNKKNAVISAGGGVVSNKIVLDYLKKDAVVIYLEAQFEEIKERLGSDTTRPLFQDREKAKKLYDSRKVLYAECADKIIITDDKTIEQVAAEIIKVVKL